MRAPFNRNALWSVMSLALVACRSTSTDVNSPPPPIPTVALAINGASSPPPINEPGAASLTWSLPNGYLPDTTACNAGGGWSGTKAVPSGSEQISGLPAATHLFILLCSNDGFNHVGADTVTFVVTPAPAPTYTLSLSCGPTATNRLP
jgi:hypothetical protein